MAGQFTGSSKRVEAHPKSSNLVVNSVSLSRDLPVFTGFFEIIRVVQEKNTKIQYYIINEGTRDVYDYSVRGELEPELSFDGLCLRVPVLGDRDPGSGLIISYYAKMGIVGVELKVDDSVTRDIYCVEASGLYAHTQAGIGFPSINLINGKLSFGGNLSINQIAEKKVEIYNDGTMKYV